MLKFIFLFIISFLPPAIYVIWIRNTEKYEREPWHAIFIAFLWGASIAIIASLILEILLEIPVYISFKDYKITSFVIAVLIAPFAEELTKPLALSLKGVKKEINEIEDGLVYGAIAGLGFSATENLFYAFGFLSYGMLLFSILIAIRSIGGCLIHASATALTGYGYSKYLMGMKFSTVFHYFILAMAVHSFYNFILSFELLGGIASIFIAIFFAILCIRYVRQKIIKLDRKIFEK